MVLNFIKQLIQIMENTINKVNTKSRGSLQKRVIHTVIFCIPADVVWMTVFNKQYTQPENNA